MSSVTDTKELKASPYFLLLHKPWQALFELCHFTEALDPRWQSQQLQMKLQDLSQPLTFRLKDLQRDESKFKIVSHYLFEDLGFQMIQESNLCFQDCLLPFVLSRRKAPAPILELLFCCLLEKCGLKVPVQVHRFQHLLKIQINKTPWIIDVGQKGKNLEPHEIVQLVNDGSDFSNSWVGSQTLVIEYLNLIEKQARKSHNPQILFIIYSYLMKYEPFNLKHLCQRALMAFEKGDNSNVIEDIRNYFQYKQDKQDNETSKLLKRIYKLALQKENQKRSGRL